LLRDLHHRGRLVLHRLAVDVRDLVRRWRSRRRRGLRRRQPARHRRLLRDLFDRERLVVHWLAVDLLDVLRRRRPRRRRSLRRRQPARDRRLLRDLHHRERLVVHRLAVDLLDLVRRRRSRRRRGLRRRQPAATDGCSATCSTEGGWSCTGSPSTCSTLCGDGVRAGAEACDDGNQRRRRLLGDLFDRERLVVHRLAVDLRDLLRRRCPRWRRGLRRRQPARHRRLLRDLHHRGRLVLHRLAVDLRRVVR
jgi:hypothetical protein